MDSTDSNRYGAFARAYEMLGHAYSGGQILACKRSQLVDLRPGERVLYAGAGGGEDAMLAARMGAKVTVVELSSAMVDEARRRFAKAGVADLIEVHCGSILDHDRPGYYDAVAANFFLNVFARETMRSVLVHLIRQVRPGGKVLVADFAPPSGGRFARAAQNAYWGAALMSFHLLANNPLHPIYDYRVHLDELGLTLFATHDFHVFGLKSLRFRTVSARTPDGPAAMG